MRTMRSIFAILTVNFVPSLLLSVFLLVCYVCLYVWKNRDYYEKISKFHSMPTVPLLGNALPLLFDRKSRFDKIMEISSQCKEWGSYVFWVSYLPIVVVTKFEDIQIVSNKSLWRSALGKFHKTVGDGIFWSHPDKWRSIRKALNRAFGPAMIEQYLIVFNKHTDNMVRKLNDVSNSGKIIDISQFIFDNSLKNITENMAGVDVQGQKEYSKEFFYSLITSMNLEISRFFEPWKFPDFIYNLYLLFSGHKDLNKNLRKLPTEIIQKKFAEYQNHKEKFQISNDGGLIVEKPVKTYIDILMWLHNTHPEFTKQQVHDELITIIAGGSEPPATVASFTFLILAINQDAQERVYQEIVEEFGNNSSKIEVKIENLTSPKFEYLDRCIKETLRKYSISPLMPRVTTEEVILTDGNVIPTGTLVLMGYHNIFNDPIIFPNPKTWDPEHFAEESVKSSFIPFGTGPKACIGSKYAMIWIKTQVIHVLHRYHLSTNIGPDNFEFEFNSFVSKKGGYPVTVTLRKNNEK